MGLAAIRQLFINVPYVEPEKLSGLNFIYLMAPTYFIPGCTAVTAHNDTTLVSLLNPKVNAITLSTKEEKYGLRVNTNPK